MDGRGARSSDEVDGQLENWLRLRGFDRETQPVPPDSSAADQSSEDPRGQATGRNRERKVEGESGDDSEPANDPVKSKSTFCLRMSHTS